MQKTTGAIAMIIGLLAMPYAVGQEKNGAISESIIVADNGVTDFTVNGSTSLFRISVSTIAGGSIEKPEINGNAKHVRTEEITFAEQNGETKSGTLDQNLVFRGTGKGRVTITVNTRNPASPQLIVNKFNVTIK